MSKEDHPTAGKTKPVRERTGRAFTFIQVSAIMVRFYAAVGFVGVDMEGVEVGTNRFDRSEVLNSRSRTQQEKEKW